MIKNVFPKAVIMASLIAGLVTFNSNQSNAVTETFQAAYEILTPLAIAQNTALDFGQIVKPSVGGVTNTFTLAPAGGISVTGAGDGTHAGSEQVGELAVTAGATGLAVDQPLTATPGACTDAANVTLDSISFGTATNSGNTNFTVAVGGALTVDGNATTGPGAGTCDYDVTATFS
jgi:hypothetical protein